jgi:hypothetical protein
MTMRFEYQERDRYTVTTERGGPIGMIRRMDERFVFVDACNLRPSGSGSIPVSADELQEVVDKLRHLESEIERDARTDRPPSAIR